MQVGIVLPVSAEMGDGGSWAGIRALAEQAEVGGADSLWVFDHFFYRWGRGGADEGSHEAFTVLAGVAAVTSRVGLGTLVACTSFRTPGILAKAAAGIDLIAPGRLTLGVGCGWHEPEYRAFGYPFDHRVSRFEETVAIVRPLLDGERVTFAGDWHQAEDAVLVPAPSTRVPMVIAASGPRMLGIAAEVADGWQAAWFGLPDAKFRGERAAWVAAREAAGERAGSAGSGAAGERDGSAGSGAAGERDGSAGSGAGAGAPAYVGVQVKAGAATSDARALALDPDAIADALAAWAAEGVDHLQLWVQPLTAANVAVAIEGLRRFRG